ALTRAELGREHSLTLINAAGQKISLGNEVKGIDRLLQDVLDYSTGPLYEKAVERFNNNEVVDFKRIQVQRQRGWRVDGIEYPFPGVFDYRVEEGRLHLQTSDGWLPGIPIDEVSQLLVLEKFFDSLAPAAKSD
ncbi:hypothetical protein MYX77_12670, partial [Acidobacteriia bacterium AH_259_A11_L15]|nr:hypothetical protein [Acidobacteriia bacterium AH_259_A11_L15]